MRDFYATVAQVLPVLLLAVIFDSGYFDQLKDQKRLPRRLDPLHGVWFWTKGWIRAYTLTMVTVAVLDLMLCVLILADAMRDRPVWRWTTTAGLILIAMSLLFRIWVSVWSATQSHEDTAPDTAEPSRLRN